MARERTLIILKPDAVQRGLVGEILTRLERRGLQIAALKFMQVSDDLARRHYAVHEGKPFFAGLVSYITSAPVLVGVFEGTDAVKVVRATVGATKPAEAAPGTIRGDFALEIGRNLIHASDAVETAQQEIALWFEAAAVVDYGRNTDAWIFEK